MGGGGGGAPAAPAFDFARQQRAIEQRDKQISAIYKDIDARVQENRQLARRSLRQPTGGQRRIDPLPLPEVQQHVFTAAQRTSEQAKIQKRLEQPVSPTSENLRNVSQTPGRNFLFTRSLRGEEDLSPTTILGGS